MRKLLTGLAFMLVLTCISVSSEAAPWYEPADLNPGDTYQIAFVTSTTTSAIDTNVQYYKDFVNSAADQNPELGKLIFNPIISTIGTNARDNAVVNGPVYNTIGQRVADGYTDMWDGQISAPILYDENGDRYNSDAWTGSWYDGTKHPNWPVGNSNPTCGWTYHTGSYWINYGRHPNAWLYPLYALSEPVAVVPIPPTLWLFASGVAGIGLLRRRYRKARSCG